MIEVELGDHATRRRGLGGLVRPARATGRRRYRAWGIL
ncbi:hypothetical protein [Bradyrhizobium elkanii]|nr:hypothetical protein [Bradyrhizobium elkanii]